MAALEPVEIPSALESEPKQRVSLRSWQRQYRRGLYLTDSVVAIGVVLLAQTLRFGSISGNFGNLGNFSSVDFSFVSAAIVLAWLSVLAIYRTRSPLVLGQGYEEYRRVWTATLWLFGAIAVLSTLFKLEIARGYLAIAFPLGLAALSVNRWLWRKYVSRRRLSGAFTSSVLAVGHMDLIEAFARSLARRPADGYRLVGLCAPGLLRRERVNIPSVGTVAAYPHDGDITLGAILEAVVKSGADTVALTSGQLDPNEIRDLSWQLEKLDVELLVSPGVIDVAGPRLTVRFAGDQPLIHVDKPQYHGAKRFEKRAFDITFSLLVLAALSSVMLVAAAAVRVTSRGPVFYLSERIGLDGKSFRMIKFRSMVINADRLLADVAHLNEGGGMLFKIRRDPRVTRVGRILRRFSIDELPQFINVVLGDMSVVGPRPPLPGEVEAYDDNVRRRLLVRPGITGLWQISGRSDLPWEEAVRLDLSYVENWSMMTDLAIATKTAGVVFRGVGAY
jgi:exopolysaccharide biosynthesis polyprenyl glycosylphosphotransferase